MEEYKTTLTSGNDFTRFYPDYTSVEADFSEEKGFYINLKNGCYTFIRIHCTEQLYDIGTSSQWKALANDNFDRTRWFEIVYDTVLKTVEIRREFKVIKEFGNSY